MPPEGVTIPPLWFPLQGEAAALGAALLWACGVCAYRAWSANLAAAQLNLFKSAVAMGVLTVAVAALRPGWPDARSGWLLAASGLIGIALGDTCFYAAMFRIGAQVTATLQCLAPPMTSLLSPIFGVPSDLAARQWLGMGLSSAAVIGVIHFSRPRAAASTAPAVEGWWLGIALALGAALCQALGTILQKLAFAETDVLLGTTLRFAPAVLVLLAWSAWRWRRAGAGVSSLAQMTRRQALVLGAAAIYSTCLGIVLYSAGTKYADAGVVAAIASTYPVWILPIAWLTLGEKMPWPAIVCIVAAVAGVALISWR